MPKAGPCPTGFVLMWVLGVIQVRIRSLLFYPVPNIDAHAAYGGRGYTSRMWGLTLDTIQAINLVLGNGTITKASKDLNPDLFWVRHLLSSFI